MHEPIPLVYPPLRARDLTPAWGFGNMDSDAEAYEKAGIDPESRRILYRLDDPRGGRRIDDYGELVESSCARGFVPKAELSSETIAALIA